MPAVLLPMRMTWRRSSLVNWRRRTFDQGDDLSMKISEDIKKDLSWQRRLSEQLDVLVATGIAMEDMLQQD